MLAPIASTKAGRIFSGAPSPTKGLIHAHRPAGVLRAMGLALPTVELRRIETRRGASEVVQAAEHTFLAARKTNG
jgi:hypothetical protein